MKPDGRLSSEREKAGIACDAQGNGLTYARLDRGDVGELDRLWIDLLAQLKESSRTLPRAAVLRALLLKGLVLADVPGTALSLTRGSVRLQYLLSTTEVERLEHFRRSRWSRGTEPNTEQLQGALVRLALPVAQASAAFACDVLIALLPRAKAQSSRPNEPLESDAIYLPQQMLARLDGIAKYASRTLGCEVRRSAIVRTAVSAWLDEADHRPTEEVFQEIRVAVARSNVPLRYFKQHWTVALAARIDELAAQAKRILVCRVSRSGVARAALGVWLDTADKRPPELVTEAIRLQLVPRGRRPTP